MSLHVFREDGQSWLQKERQKCQKNKKSTKHVDMLNFSQGCDGLSYKPHCYSSIMSHCKAYLSFQMFIFRPGAGNLSAAWHCIIKHELNEVMDNSCSNWQWVSLLSAKSTVSTKTEQLKNSSMELISGILGVMQGYNMGIVPVHLTHIHSSMGGFSYTINRLACFGGKKKVENPKICGKTPQTVIWADDS